MIKYKCLIVDDEPLAMAIIEKYLQGLPNFEIIAKCENAVMALNYIKSDAIDVVFLDISMPFISGLDFIRTLVNPPKIILTTAHEEFAVAAYEWNVLDYLLKPISFERFLKAVNKLQNIPATIENTAVAEKPSAENFIYVRNERRSVKVVLSDILFIESVKDQIKIHTNAAVIVTPIPISEIIQRLPEDFIRIHRSFVISKNKITAFSQHDFEIGAQLIPVGRSYKSNAISLMKTLEGRQK